MVGQFRTTSIGRLLSLVLGIRRLLYRQRSELDRSLKHTLQGRAMSVVTYPEGRTLQGRALGVVTHHEGRFHNQ